MGKCDFIAIFEVPKENNVVTILLCIGNKRNIRTTTMKAWPESDAAKLLAAANLSFQL